MDVCVVWYMMDACRTGLMDLVGLISVGLRTLRWGPWLIPRVARCPAFNRTVFWPLYGIQMIIVSDKCMHV